MVDPIRSFLSQRRILLFSSQVRLGPPYLYALVKPNMISSLNFEAWLGLKIDITGNLYLGSHINPGVALTLLCTIYSCKQ